MAKTIGDWHNYSGAIHMHTTESDGTKTLEDVVAIGQRAGLDFMLFTDHMTLSLREAGKEGYYGKTLVIIGYEHNDPDDKNHYLIFNSPRVYDEDFSVRQYVKASVDDSAIGILAHPDEIRDKLVEYPPYPWTDWSVDGFTGIELWNQMSEWMEKLTRFNKLMMSFSPRKSMTGPTQRILNKWDELNMKRKVVGIAGVDAHAFPVKAGPFTVEIFPYKVHFRSLRTHILLPHKLSEDFNQAKQQFYSAIRDARVFFSNMRWGGADSFEFYGVQGATRVVSGGSLPSADSARLIVKLPSHATIRLIHNGIIVLTTDSDSLEYSVKAPGIYRVEVWKGNRGWIFSNHIRIGISER
jgi:hypothetical protein